MGIVAVSGCEAGLCQWTVATCVLTISIFQHWNFGQHTYLPHSLLIQRLVCNCSANELVVRHCQ